MNNKADNVNSTVDADIAFAPPRADYDFTKIGKSSIDIVPAHTTVIVKKEWDISFTALMAFHPFVDNNDVTTINFPSGFSPTKLEVVGVGSMAYDRLPLEVGMIVEMREAKDHQMKRILLHDNTKSLDEVFKSTRIVFDEIKDNDGKDEAGKKASLWTFTIVEYIMTDVFNIAYIYR